MAFFRLLQRAFALLGLVGTLLALVLWQTTGAPTPCAAVAAQARPYLQEASTKVVDSCIGARGDGGLAGLVVELGLAVTGQSRDKIQKRLVERMDLQMRANLLSTGTGRCLVVLTEGLVGRPNGGPRELAADLAEAQIAECRGK